MTITVTTAAVGTNQQSGKDLEGFLWLKDETTYYSSLRGDKVLKLLLHFAL